MLLRDILLLAGVGCHVKQLPALLPFFYGDQVEGCQVLQTCEVFEPGIRDGCVKIDMIWMILRSRILTGLAKHSYAQTSTK